jgi:hypothetical protein
VPSWPVIITMVSVEHMNVVCSSSPASWCFYYGGSDGERSWLRLEPTHEIAKLTVFLWMSLSFFLPMWEKRWDRQTGGDLAVMHTDNFFCIIDLFVVIPLLTSNIELYLVLCFPFSCHVVQDHRILVPV